MNGILSPCLRSSPIGVDWKLLTVIIECIEGNSIEIVGTTLVAARLDGLNLHRALLDGQNLQRASCINTDFRGAFVSDANLEGSALNGASLITAFLIRTLLRRAVLDGARAIGCRFDDGDLTEASLDGVDVGYASFERTRLHGAKLLCKRIELASFKEALFDSNTIWPVGFDPIAAGAILEVIPAPDSKG